VLRYGMSEEIGFVSFEEAPTLLGNTNYEKRSSYSDETAKLIDTTVKALVMKAYNRALHILHEKRAVLENAAQHLLAKETLTEDELHPYFTQMQLNLEEIESRIPEDHHLHH